MCALVLTDSPVIVILFTAEVLLINKVLQK